MTKVNWVIIVNTCVMNAFLQENELYLRNLYFFYLSVAKACVSQQHGGDGRSVSSVRQPDSTEGCPRFPCRAEK